MKPWRWTYVWCGNCNDSIVNLGRRWIVHTDERPWCMLCFIRHGDGR